MDKLTQKEFLNLKKLLLKKYRLEQRCFLIEGKHLIEEAQDSKLLKYIVTSDKDYKNSKIKVKYCSKEDIKKLTTTKTPQDFIGVCNFFIDRDIKDRVVLLNNINDPGNLGTIIRTARSFGFSDVIVEGVDIYNPKVLRATQGSIFKINVKNIKSSISFLSQNKNKYSIIGTVLDEEAIKYEQIEGKIKKEIILVLGNEAKGIDKQIYKYLDHKVYIPIKFESLNVAIAGGILMEKISVKNTNK